MVVGVLHGVRDAAYRRAAAGGGAPVLLALDEVANIAPVPDLPAMVSEGAGQGLLTLAALQDLSQARRRWGPEAAAFPSLFGTTVVLAGISDLPTLEALSALAGDHEVPTRTVGTSTGRGRAPPPVRQRGDRAAAAAAGRRGGAGRAGLGDRRGRPQPRGVGAAHAGPRHWPWRELAAPDRARTLPRGRLPARTHHGPPLAGGGEGRAR